jgi:hypothetical protein
MKDACTLITIPGRRAACRRFVLLGFLWLCLTPPVQSAGEAKTLQRTIDPVLIQGYELPWLKGKDIDRLGVYAYREGKMVPVPFQIDQRDSSGNWVWDVVYRQPFVFKEEGKNTISMRNPVYRGPGTVDDQDPRGKKLLDANDVLVFMAADVGDRHPEAGDEFGPATVLEIEVSDSLLQTSGWIYVTWQADSPPLRSGKRYMRYGHGTEKVVQSPAYRFHYSDNKAALIQDLVVNEHPIADRIRIRGKISLSLPFFSSPIAFDEEDIIGYTEGYIAGPVRIIKRNIVHLSLGGGLFNTPEVTCDHFYYANLAEVPVCLFIHFPVKQVAMMLTTDYRDPPFHNLYMGGEAPVSIEPEEQALVSRLHRLGTEWIALDSGEASIISLLVVPETLQGLAEAMPCLCSAREEGQAVEEARAVTGAHTEAGFLITSSTRPPKGEHVIYGTYLISAGPYEPGDEDAVLAVRDRKLTTCVTLLTPAP